MKKFKFLIPLTMLAGLTLAGCSLDEFFGSLNTSTEQGNNQPSQQSSSNASSQSESSGVVDFSGDVIGEGVVVEVPETPEVPVVENDGEFKLTTKDGTFTETDGVCSITAAGTYTASGVLANGQILVNVADNEDEVEDVVVLELSGATISYDQDSPIKCLSAEKFEISAKKNTSNAVYDLREHEVTEDKTLGAGAINAKADLKLKGTGSLYVSGNYKNGVHCTKDLKIQKETLYVDAWDNAIKGKNSVEIVSGEITAVSQSGNGIKTDDSDVSSKGKQRGNIDITGGTVIVDSAQDAIQAEYNLNINQTNEDGVETKVSIKTGANSKYASNYDKETSAKGLKAENVLTVSDGTVVVQASDDAIHANHSGEALGNGELGLGNIVIEGGVINIASGDDGMHADNTLTITGGQSLITNSKEGIEANHIVISGGYTKIHGSDDGVNASKKINEAPSIVVSGGTLDVQVAEGDTDGIDSNGTFSQTGGLIISRGSPNTAEHMSTGLDCDGTASISGGTFIAFNGMETTPSTSGSVIKAYYGDSSSSQFPGGGGGPQPGGGGGHRAGPGDSSQNQSYFQSGTYTLSGGDLSISFYNQYTYSTFLVYPSGMSTGVTYTLLNGEDQVLSWTQSSSNQKIS